MVLFFIVFTWYSNNTAFFLNEWQGKSGDQFFSTTAANSHSEHDYLFRIPSCYIPDLASGCVAFFQIYLFLKINKKIYSILFLAILTLSLIVIFFIENREMDYFYTQGNDMQKLTISLSRSSLPDII